MSPTVTVYPARCVRTMDPGRPIASAVAVMSGRVLSTGTLESMRPWLDRYDYEIDDSLREKVILPGFLDPHTHLLISSSYLGVSYVGPVDSPGPCGTNPGLPDRDAVLEKLRSLGEELPAGQALVAWGLDPAAQGGHLDRDELDAITGDRPTYVISYAPHFLYINSAGLARSGVREDLDVHGVGRYPDGRLNGQFVELAAHKAALGRSAADLVESAGSAGLSRLARMATAAGITTTAEMMFGLSDIEQEWRIHDRALNAARSPIRMALVTAEMPLHDRYGEQAVPELLRLHERNTQTVFFHGVKFFADGSLPALSLRAGFPGYLDLDNGVRGDIPWEQLNERMLPFWSVGIPIHCHANGDEAIEATLQALSRLQANRPRFEHGFTLEHYCISTPNQAHRLRELGAQASVNPYFVHYRGQLHSHVGYGPDRAEAFARLGSLEREGVPFGLHSDFCLVPVPMHPLTAAWVAVNRLAEDETTTLAPGERIGVERALRAVTVDAAQMLGMQQHLGSLEPGKFADFAALDEDPFVIDPTEIKNIPVWGTALSGMLHQA